MDDGAGDKTERDRPAPDLLAGGQKPDHPWQIGNAGDHIIGKHKGGSGRRRALGEQGPGGGNEGGDNDENQGDKRHETPGAPGHETDLDVSSSGLFSLGCSRWIFPAVSATLGPATARPLGTLVATRSIEQRYPPMR